MDPKSGLEHFETLIRTELGAYFILDEDSSTDEVKSRRVTATEALEFQEVSKASMGASARPELRR